MMTTALDPGHELVARARPPATHALLLILLSVVILLVGLVSEQISSLRFEGRV